MMRIIVAMDSLHGMATEDGIPWTLPTDQEFFSDQISSGLILMGHTTYTEIEKPLHQRTNYVASRRRDITVRPGFEQVVDVPAFVRTHAGEVIQNIGGASLFGSTLQFADELVLTRIDGDFGCTRFFPPFEVAFRIESESEPVTENGSTFTVQRWAPRRES